MIIIKNTNPLSSIKTSWEILLKTKSRTRDESVLHESPAVYEFLPYNLRGFSLSKNGRLNYSFDILKLFPEYDLKKIEEETVYWEKEMILGDKIGKIVRHLKNNFSSRRAIVSLWKDSYCDNSLSGAACTHTFYFRTKLEGELEMHTHARANDLYNCVYIDLQFINFIHRLVADKLNMDVGKHIHFVDALHVYKKDFDKIETQTNFIQKSKIWN